jgi:hypothetical protein
MASNWSPKSVTGSTASPTATTSALMRSAACSLRRAPNSAARGQITRQHEQRQIDRAVRAQKTCERDHRGPATETYERQV